MNKSTLDIAGYQKEGLTDYHILKTVENDASISQRKLSYQMNVNVASVNFALKRLIKKGFVRMVGINPRRIKYYITPKGLKEKTNLAYMFFGRNFHFFKEIRNDIEAQIKKVNGNSKGQVAIYGENELAEIAYMAVVVMRVEFIGFFVEGPNVTNNELFGHKVQKLEVVGNIGPFLLLLTESPSSLSTSHIMKNFNTLNLLNYYKLK